MSDKNLPPTSRSSFEWDGTKIKKFIGKETEVVIPEGTTDIGWYAFEGCSSLKSVVIPFSVTVIGNSAFKDCTSLTSVLIPEGVQRIRYHAFSNCKNLSSVKISGSVKIVYEAFRGCPVPWFSRVWRHKFWDWCKSSHCWVFGE